jgi:hypothetical protein
MSGKKEEQENLLHKITVFSHADFFTFFKSTKLTLCSRLAHNDALLIAKAFILCVLSFEASQEEFLLDANATQTS